MDQQSHCIVCGNSFEYRKGKLYCSDSCKTKSYNLRKEGSEVSGSHMRPKGSTVSFNLDEYEKWTEIESSFTLTIDVFFFFRKNLPTNISVERIDKVLKEYYEKNYITESGAVSSDFDVLFNSFKEFQKLFFDGFFKIENTSSND